MGEEEHIFAVGDIVVNKVRRRLGRIYAISNEGLLAAQVLTITNAPGTYAHETWDAGECRKVEIRSNRRDGDA